MRKLILILCCWTAFSNGIAQSGDFETLRATIQQFRSQTVSKANDEASINSYNDSLRAVVKQYLSLPNSFQHPIDSVAYLADMYSPDKAFRIVTWNIGKKDLTNVYYAFVQYQMKDKSYVVYELDDQSAKQFRTVEFKSFTYKNWYGALYYEIIPFKHKGKPHYILLGWDGNDKLSNKKVIEVLYFDRKGAPRFGANVFLSEEKSKRRVVIQYTKDATISLRYHPDKKMIVYDHLAPMKPELEGLYEFYAPDLSYDGYVLKGGVWKHKEAIDVFSKKSEKPYNDPRTIKEPIKKE